MAGVVLAILPSIPSYVHPQTSPRNTTSGASPRLQWPGEQHHGAYKLLHPNRGSRLIVHTFKLPLPNSCSQPRPPLPHVQSSHPYHLRWQRHIYGRSSAQIQSQNSARIGSSSTFQCLRQPVERFKPSPCYNQHPIHSIKPPLNSCIKRSGRIITRDGRGWPWSSIR